MRWLSLGWRGQKIPFFSWVNCAISGYQKGLVDCRGHPRFSIVETDTQILKSHALLMKVGFLGMSETIPMSTYILDKGQPWCSQPCEIEDPRSGHVRNSLAKAILFDDGVS